MTKHLSLILLRLLIAFGIWQLVPFVHARWGHQYLGDGQDAFGFILIFSLVALAAGVAYLVVGSLLHFFRRHRSWLGIAAADTFLGISFAGLLAFAGITATYFDASGTGAPSGAERPNTGRR
ncbi:MAG TPA: hypothetical protein VF614_13130 [Chthoniobacteraceae bacterium]